MSGCIHVRQSGREGTPNDHRFDSTSADELRSLVDSAPVGETIVLGTGNRTIKVAVPPAEPGDLPFPRRSCRHADPAFIRAAERTVLDYLISPVTERSRHMPGLIQRD